MVSIDTFVQLFRFRAFCLIASVDAKIAAIGGLYVK